MGAMQAQDYPMSKWAVGIRLPGSTDKMVEDALNNAEIVRTHLMRPTWHLVSAGDIYWMLGLTAARIKNSLRGRHLQLELTVPVINKAKKLIEKALAGGRSATREMLVKAFNKAGISTDNNRASHLFLIAELDGLICSGVKQGNSPTYALLEERIPVKVTLGRKEALARLAWKYFSSHGPATLQDFSWWSGMTAGDARQAVELIKENFNAVVVDSTTYWMSNSMPEPKGHETSVFLLPAYDEFIISYKDRTATLDSKHYQQAVYSNGSFRPVIVVNGKGAGLWKKSVINGTAVIETTLFHPVDKSARKLIQKAEEGLLHFLPDGSVSRQGSFKAYPE